ncbi:helix-turn-helix domain-containing protein [Leucobacter tenebrionis]|uniref:helix-turn-helix domain-containing protein n=1 Tax=Leucobacter tenebrionis TaxID=2873270 RepID=UPI001CA64308|nr:helix-turn-helix domain-containing protein [Leucobacter tenebrionis]QZY51710.1 helix-turn-helix domain-containing protein [Leucobacter tenebrionis]
MSTAREPQRSGERYGAEVEIDIDLSDSEPGRRPEQWGDALGRVLDPLDVEFTAEPHALGRMQAMALDACTLVSIQSNAHRARRTPQQVRTMRDPAHLMITYQLSGLAVIRQGGHTLLIRPGEFAVTELARPFEVIVNGHHERMATVIPGSAVSAVVSDFDALSASTIGSSDGPARVLSSVLEGFFFNRALLGPFDRMSAGGFVRDLIAAMLRLHAPLSLQEEERPLTDVLAFIEHNLRDPDLTPAVVAASHFMSVRSLQLLFKPHNWTPSGWIRHRRMHHALHELAAPSNGSTVSDIASRWGFADLAHFSRVCKQATGVSPREYRRSTREGERAPQAGRLTTTEDFFSTARRATAEPPDYR